MSYSDTSSSYTIDDDSILNYEQPSLEGDKREQKAIYKNIFLISIGFTLLFTAYNAMAGLQSSINYEDGLGTASLAATYSAMVLSCMFLPSLFVKKFTTKWTIVICMLSYSTYMAAQFYPKFYTLVPTAIILGMGAAPLWSAKCAYLTHVGNRYAVITPDDSRNSETMIVAFFGIFFLFFQSAGVWGSLISSTVLQITSDNSSEPTDLDHCGVHFGPDVDIPSGTFEISDRSRYILSGVYLIIALLGATFVAVFVDPLKRFGGDSKSTNQALSGKDLLIATFKHMKKWDQIMMIPLTLWSGLEQGFFAADYTAAFVTCSWDVSKVGYIMICYGVTDSICSFGFGHVVNYVGGRIPLFIFGAAVNVGSIIAMFVWSPNPDQKAIYFVIAGLWGMSDAIWQTQINGLYGVLFQDHAEAAFSNYRLWESLGFVLVFSFANAINVKSKLIILLVALAVGMLGYIEVEYRIWRQKNIQKSREQNPVDLR